MEEYITRIIEKAIDNRLDVATTKKFVKILEKTDYTKAFETPIGTFAEMTGNYKTILARCAEFEIKTVGDLVRCGGREMRKSTDVGAKTAALISDTLADNFGIYDWFSKNKED